MKKNIEIYSMIDVEADGPIPGPYSMLSFGCATYDIDKNLLGTFTRNLDLLTNATQHSETMEFWNRTETNKKAYAATRIDTVRQMSAMKDFADHLNDLPGTPIFAGYPAVYDFKWIDYYFHMFYGNNPFGFSRAVDVKSFAWSLIGGKLQHCTKRNMPKEWFDEFPHTHVALEDSIEQGALWINILRYSKKLPAIKGIPNYPQDKQV